jgi:hypothetical protein
LKKAQILPNFSLHASGVPHRTPNLTREKNEMKISDPSKIMTRPWVASEHWGEKRPPAEVVIDEQCVRVRGLDGTGHDVHTLACTGQNPFNLAVRFYQVTVARAAGSTCGRPGCTHTASQYEQRSGWADLAQRIRDDIAGGAA